ncbi:hypothetical protein HPB48_003192 [Haemaphysalis longicornis]|uniref:Uncharacterized protein n=1 Tax=Haemaphysalis longicornis TaxID=44386 RepID=A0A9J6GUW2_HAELO|nr:hypothetical protein HPB48_003192 [Haemaphysalis longicornis]
MDQCCAPPPRSTRPLATEDATGTEGKTCLALPLRLSRERVRRQGSAPCAPASGTLRKAAAACCPIGGGSDEMFQVRHKGPQWLEVQAGGAAETHGTSKGIRLNMCGVWVRRAQECRRPPIVAASFVGESPAEIQCLPVVEEFVGERRVRVLRDTRCNTVIVNRCLVPDEDLTGAISPFRLLDRSVLMLPEACITVATPYFSGRLKAKCLVNSTYDLVFGNVEGARPVNCLDPHWDKEAKLHGSAPGNELDRHRPRAEATGEGHRLYARDWRSDGKPRNHPGQKSGNAN